MTHFRFVRLPVTLAVLAACATAHADYTSPDGQFRLSGFGTLGASRSSTNDALFNYPGQGGGADKKASLNPDSKIALQGTYKFTPSLSATAQLMMKYDAEGEYVPNPEWVFAKWQPASGLSLRAGRMGAPFFMVSDFRDVGYANTTVRPNLDVYGQVPVSYFDGADAAYQMDVGSVTVTSTLWAGNAKSDFASALRRNGAAVPPTEVRIDNAVGLNVLAELSSGYALRVGHMQGKLTTKSALAQGVMTAARSLLSPEAAQSVIETVTTDDTRATFSGIGLTVDRDNVVAAAEFTKRKVKKGYIADTTGWYVMGGYRVGAFLPYVSFSKLKVDDPNAAVPSDAGLLTSSVSNILNTQKISQRTTSVGVRWDVMRNVALKAQYDRVSKPANSNGLFLVADPTTASGQSFLNNKKDVNVFTVSMDFVF